jgi:hypothetical protein
MFHSSDTITEISKALVTALGTMTDIRKGREAKVPTKAGSSYSYKYADLADTIQSVRPTLALNGLAVLQNVSTTNPDLVLISTTILHTSGEFITFDALALPAGRTAQETGSAISYGRRYHLLACLGLAAEDDDGASASPRGSKKVSRPVEVVTPKQPPTDRTTEEKAIRDILANLPNDISANIKQSFVTKFGKLADVATDQHPDALAWVEDRVMNYE